MVALKAQEMGEPSRAADRLVGFMSRDTDPSDHDADIHEGRLLWAGDALKDAMGVRIHRRPDASRCQFAANYTDPWFQTKHNAFCAYCKHVHVGRLRFRVQHADPLTLMASWRRFQ